MWDLGSSPENKIYFIQQISAFHKSEIEYKIKQSVKLNPKWFLFWFSASFVIFYIYIIYLQAIEHQPTNQISVKLPIL